MITSEYLGLYGVLFIMGLNVIEFHQNKDNVK